MIISGGNFISTWLLTTRRCSVAWSTERRTGPSSSGRKSSSWCMTSGILRYDKHWIIVRTSYSIIQERQDMKNMFRVCATERLFIPDMFPSLDRAIYIDTDLIFLRYDDPYGTCLRIFLGVWFTSTQLHWHTGQYKFSFVWHGYLILIPNIPSFLFKSSFLMYSSIFSIFWITIYHWKFANLVSQSCTPIPLIILHTLFHTK